MEIISASKLRPRLAATIEKVEAGTAVIVTKLNLPKVVMVSYEYYLDAEVVRTSLASFSGGDATGGLP